MKEKGGNESARQITKRLRYKRETERDRDQYINRQVVVVQLLLQLAWSSDAVCTRH